MNKQHLRVLLTHSGFKATHTVGETSGHRHQLCSLWASARRTSSHVSIRADVRHLLRTRSVPASVPLGNSLADSGHGSMSVDHLLAPDLFQYFCPFFAAIYYIMNLWSLHRLKPGTSMFHHSGFELLLFCLSFHT